MNSQASSEFEYARQDDEQQSREGNTQTTSQAERALMHPDQSDLEWRYYCHAWSN